MTLADDRLWHIATNPQSPEFTVGIDAKRTFVDKRSRPTCSEWTHVRHAPVRSFAAQIQRRSLFCSSPFAVLMA